MSFLFCKCNATFLVRKSEGIRLSTSQMSTGKMILLNNELKTDLWKRERGGVCYVRRRNSSGNVIFVYEIREHGSLTSNKHMTHSTDCIKTLRLHTVCSCRVYSKSGRSCSNKTDIYFSLTIPLSTSFLRPTGRVSSGG